MQINTTALDYRKHEGYLLKHENVRQGTIYTCCGKLKNYTKCHDIEMITYDRKTT